LLATRNARCAMEAPLIALLAPQATYSLQLQHASSHALQPIMITTESALLANRLAPLVMVPSAVIARHALAHCSSIWDLVLRLAVLDSSRELTTSVRLVMQLHAVHVKQQRRLA
jgi:hypothetical protein